MFDHWAPGRKWFLSPARSPTPALDLAKGWGWASILDGRRRRPRGTTLRGNQGRLRLPPKAARTFGPRRSRPHHSPTGATSGLLWTDSLGQPVCPRAQDRSQEVVDRPAGDVVEHGAYEAPLAARPAACPKPNGHASHSNRVE